MPNVQWVTADLARRDTLAAALEGADRLFLLAGNVDDMVPSQEAGVEWTILRPHVFMPNVLDQRHTIRDSGRIHPPAGNAAVPMIDTRDSAAVAAAAPNAARHAAKAHTVEQITGRRLSRSGSSQAITQRRSGNPDALRVLLSASGRRLAPRAARPC